MPILPDADPQDEQSLMTLLGGSGAAMRAPTWREQLREGVGDVYEGLSQQPLGRVLDALGMTDLGGVAREQRQAPGLKRGIMLGRPGRLPTAATSSPREALAREGVRLSDDMPVPVTLGPQPTVANLARAKRPLTQLMRELLGDREAVEGGRRLEQLTRAK